MAGFRWMQDNGIGREEKEIQLPGRQRSPALPASFQVALGLHEGGFGVARRWLWGPNPLAINRLWGGFGSGQVLK